MSTPQASRWRLDTLAGCQLAIGSYPLFRYDARGGGGIAECGIGTPKPDGTLRLTFAAERLQIPALCGRTTRLLGVPLPPGLSITVLAKRLEGLVNPRTGAVDLQFEASFRFRVQLGGITLLAPPDLQISTCLSSTGHGSRRHPVQGQPLNQKGQTRLVGVAMVPPCGARWLDRFLALPDEALAVLQCRLGPLQDPGA